MIILIKIIKREMNFEIQKQNNVMFYIHKYKKNRVLVTLREDSTLEDVYEIAKTRMFARLHTKWQYYRRTSIKTMDEIMEDIHSQKIHDIFVTNSEYKEILSVPNDKSKTIREFINENEKFFSKSAHYFKTIYNLFVVDEYAVRDMILEQNKPKRVSVLEYYNKCITA